MIDRCCSGAQGAKVSAEELASILGLSHQQTAAHICSLYSKVPSGVSAAAKSDPLRFYGYKLHLSAHCVRQIFVCHKNSRQLSQLCSDLISR